MPITTDEAAAILEAWTPSSGGGGGITTGPQTFQGQKTFADDTTIEGRLYTGDISIYGSVTAEETWASESLRTAAGFPLEIGTETIVTAGTDISVAGAGSTPAPYVITNTMNPDYSALVSGVATMRRWDASSAALTCNSGELRLTFFTNRKAFTATKLQMKTGTTAAAATPTLCKMGLYVVETNGDLTLIGATASDTATMFRATQTVYEVAMTASVAMLAGSRYAMGPLIVTGAASANFAGVAPTGMTTGGAVLMSSTAPVLTGILTGQTDLPSSITAGSLGTTAQMFYGAVLP